MRLGGACAAVRLGGAACVTVVVAVVAAAVAAPGAAPLAMASARAAGPSALSAERGPVPIASQYGSGAFGRWQPDRFGLPSYLYEIDQRVAPQAAQAELGGKRDAWHQLGNDHVVAFARAAGNVRLWSQDRVYHWINLEEPEQGQYGGGYGYLRVGGKTISTYYDDQPAAAGVSRRFAAGYVERIVPARPVSVRERVFAPWGDEPLLVHEVVLRNHTDRPVTATWWEVSGVNPVQQLPAKRVHRGLEPPRYDAADRTLTVREVDPQDARPHTIFAAPLDAPIDGFESDGAAFYGDGGRADPAAVRADRAGGSIAAPVLLEQVGRTVAAFRSPVTLAPGRTVTLRYALGYAHAEQVAGIVERARARSRSAFATTVAAWRDWLPKIRFGRDRPWLSRELQWDAYALRSGTSYEEGCGHHIISQGGFYQYSFGFQGAYRDPLQHMLPMIWLEPEIAREVLRYSAVTQPADGFIPYAQLGNCRRFDFGTSNDLDVWFLLSAAEYGLATRDTAFFDERLPYHGSRATGTLWEHLKLAFRHQESQRGPNGGYIMGATGDWSDFSTEFGPFTESNLVVAQAAFIYPRLAELAELRGDTAFAKELRATGEELRGVLARQWTGRGWYARAWLLTQRYGEGVIYGEPQPWALLADVPDATQRATLVANIRRYLTGHGGPRGPARIGSAMSPARDDPDVSERTVMTGVGTNNAVYAGGAWYAINGWLVWALTHVDDAVPGAGAFAWDEFLRNTLAAHSTAYPDAWNGTISVDDACRAHFDPEPSRCGVGLSSSVSGWIMHQPAWSLFGAIRMAGIEPMRDGLRIAPHAASSRFDVRLRGVGVARDRDGLRGYIRPERGGVMALEIVLPDGTAPRRAHIAGRRVAVRREGRSVRLSLTTRAGKATDWALTLRRAAATAVHPSR
jgi:hypothetical protein